MTENYNERQNEQLSKKELAQKKKEEKEESNARLDENYDGYYDDVLPVKEEKKSREIDTETIKKIAILAFGGIVVIGFCVFLLLK